MVQDDQCKWLEFSIALEISCVSVKGRTIERVGGKLPNGSKWNSSVEAVMEALQSGVRYYVNVIGEAQLVTVGRDDRGNVSVKVGLFIEGWDLLLRLPRCPEEDSRQIE